MQALVPSDAATGDVTRVDGRLDDAAVVAVARRFELPALLRVLRRRGYAAEDVFFESVRGAPASPGLVDSLRFKESPRRVIVRLSAGLLAPDGPLPSYFRRFAEEMVDPRPFLAFLRFFDHVVAANLSYVAYPVDGVAHGSPLARAYQTIGGARSPARVHALVRAIVPELALEVFPAMLTRLEPNDAARLGEARLDGTAVVGWSQRTAAAGLVARLSAEVEHDDHGRPWAEVVRERCERLLVPLVRRGARQVEVRLRIGSYGGRAQLGRGAQLGVEPVRRRAVPSLERSKPGAMDEPEAWEITVLRVTARGVSA
jgi:hypothetical protein